MSQLRHQVTAQIDAQGTRMETLFHQQMQSIEQLLSKRSRSPRRDSWRCGQATSQIGSCGLFTLSWACLVVWHLMMHWFAMLGSQCDTFMLTVGFIMCLLGGVFSQVLFSPVWGQSSEWARCHVPFGDPFTFPVAIVIALIWTLNGVSPSRMVNLASCAVGRVFGSQCCYPNSPSTFASSPWAISSRSLNHFSCSTLKARCGSSCVSGSSFSIRVWARLCVWVVCCCRIGEAAVPGPQTSFEIGVCNPSGLPSKAYIFNSYHADLWLVTETHLTRPGLRTFRNALTSFQSPYRWIIHGNEVLPRSQVSDVGKWTGVAAVSKWPTRRLTHDWDQCLHSTGRLVASTSFINDLWVSGITVYGTPVGPTHPGARETTEALLRAAIKRVIQAVGCRFIGGDFNCDHDTSPAIAQLRALGFQDVQDLQFKLNGKLPQATCRGRTRRDFLFVSPELAVRFLECRVDDTLWPDHAAVFGVFTAQNGCNIRYTWPIPQPLDWNLLSPSYTGKMVSFEGCEDCTALYSKLWHQKEQDVVDAALCKGSVVSPLSLGRASQLQPRRSNAACPPVKAGRHGDIQPAFLGFSMIHLKWFRQLRRMHSYVRLVEHAPLSDSQIDHRNKLWHSIRTGSGFKPSFVVWWGTRSHCVGEISSIPDSPPPFSVASLIFQAFDWEVRALEKSLVRHRNYESKLKRSTSMNQLFRAVRRDQPEQVDVLIQDVQAVVSNTYQDDCSVDFDRELPWNLDGPFYHTGQQLDVVHAEPDRLWLSSVDHIQPGDTVVQPRRIGNLDAPQ